MLKEQVSLPLSETSPSAFPHRVGLAELLDLEIPERRLRARADVRWDVRLIRGAHQQAVCTVTENLSPEGFYCRSGEPFVPGEFVECHILVPTHARRSNDAFLCLECLAQIVRVEPATHDDLHGVACHIKAYRVPAAQPSQVD